MYLSGKGICQYLLGVVQRGAALGAKRAYLVHGYEGEQAQTLFHVRVVYIAPVLIEIVYAGLVGVEPQGALLGLTHLLSLAGGEEGGGEAVCGLLLLLADKLYAAQHVAPLVVAAHLEHAAVLAVELEEVVALKQHIAHLEEGEAFFHALLVALEGEHAVYGILGAYIPHEIEEVEAAEPVGVVGDYGLAVRKVYKAGHLLLKTGGVVVYLLGGHHPAHIALAGGVADAGGAAAQEDYGEMACALHVGHCHQCYIVTDMQAVGSRVIADIKGCLFLSQELAELFGVGALLEKATFSQYIVYVCHRDILLFGIYYCRYRNSTIQPPFIQGKAGQNITCFVTTLYAPQNRQHSTTPNGYYMREITHPCREVKGAWRGLHR